MPVEILHDLVGEHTRGSVVETGDLSPGVLRRLLDLGAVRMVPTDAPEKPLELTPEQQRLVNENAELSDRLDSLEREVAALRIDNGKLRQDLGCSQELLGETQQLLLNREAELARLKTIEEVKVDLQLDQEKLAESLTEGVQPIVDKLRTDLQDIADKAVEQVQTSVPAPKKSKK